ncbi:MAG: type II toxin-antitoxin system VapC family toxin [Candidatus ainarchaeum sp.]|nr:type II toxin-antitoxin system VapC family toxin [Candidatus ainarchaeum sp.]
MKRVYLDSNVFISWINQEINGNFRPLFAEAELFFRKAKEQGNVLVLPGLFFQEVERKTYQNKESVLAYFETRGIKTEIVQAPENLPLKDFLDKGVHFLDAFHAAIAIEKNCGCIVTFNVKDFEKIKEKIEIFLPSDF